MTFAAEVQLGDKSYRVGSTIAGVQEDGINSDGEPLAVLSYEGFGRAHAPWRAFRVGTVILPDGT